MMTWEQAADSRRKCYEYQFMRHKLKRWVRRLEGEAARNGGAE